ncbi:MAG TPA: helix-turn-helix transcriptional regulator [bacterium]|nr:helix-turn-helix transcriptional regulator [bacterium]
MDMPEPRDIRIVVYDRNAPFAESARDYLRGLGYRAEAAAAPGEAMRALKSGRCQVLVAEADYSDPSDLVAQASVEFPNLCVVAMTDMPLEDGTNRWPTAFARIKKPFPFQKLADILDRAITLDRIFFDLEERVMNNIGRRLRAARRMRGLTLAELSERAGLSASLISKIETASAAPSVSSLVKLSRILDIRIASLFE